MKTIQQKELKGLIDILQKVYDNGSGCEILNHTLELKPAFYVKPSQLLEIAEITVRLSGPRLQKISEIDKTVRDWGNMHK